MKRTLPYLLIPVLAAALAVLWRWHPGPVQPPGLAARPQGGDFTLRSARGPISLHDLRGKVVLLYFGYTSCPDVCPTNLAQIGAALKRLTAEERRGVAVIFVSVDPERDTPERLARYTAFFAPDMVGVTGTPEQVAAVARQYGVAYRKVASDSALGYLVDHSAFTYVVDPQGRLRETLPHAAPIHRILAAIRRWLPGGQTTQP